MDNGQRRMRFLFSALTTISSFCNFAKRDEPSSGSNVHEVSTSLCSPFFLEGNIVYWTALYFKYMEILLGYVTFISFPLARQERSSWI